MKYRSTRSEGGGTFSFREAVLSGSTDGGLLVPVAIPFVPRETREKWKSLKYTDLCFEVLRIYIDKDEIPDADLLRLIDCTYKNFRHEEVTPVRRFDFCTDSYKNPGSRKTAISPSSGEKGGKEVEAKGEERQEKGCREIGVVEDSGNCASYYLLELYHGPTYAFKDVALQLLGNTFEYLLEDCDKRMVILAATSGDTGSAAIAGFRKAKQTSCVVLFPKGRTSRIQQLQMTTMNDTKDHCIAVEGTFDNCQKLVKECLQSELRQSLGLAVVNSINWMRILAQMVYYWYACFRVLEKEPQAGIVDFCVPTGNFGNILAGYYSRMMGAPIGNLIIASNENNILERCVKTGEYQLTEVRPTMSPSMDIQVSSNFERFLFDVYGGDAKEVKALFSSLRDANGFVLEKGALQKMQSEFQAFSASDRECGELITEIYRDCHRILDPHTAVGVVCARKFRKATEKERNIDSSISMSSGIISSDSSSSSSWNRSNPCVCAATAHFGKFVDTVEELLGRETIAAEVPLELLELEKQPQRYSEMSADLDDFKTYLIKHFGTEKRQADEEEEEGGAKNFLDSFVGVVRNRLSSSGVSCTSNPWTGMSLVGIATVMVGLLAVLARRIVRRW